MNFASVLEKRYENSRFAHFYTNSFALIRESNAIIRESFMLIRESYAFIRESVALIRENNALIREKYIYENEPYRLSYFSNMQRIYCTVYLHVFWRAR